MGDKKEVVAYKPQEIVEVLSAFSVMKPKDKAIFILGTDFVDKAIQFAKDHLDECADCVKFVSSDGKYAVQKIDRDNKVYDFEADEKYIKLKAAKDKADAALKAYTAKAKPTHIVTTHYYKKSNV